MQKVGFNVCKFAKIIATTETSLSLRQMQRTIMSLYHYLRFINTFSRKNMLTFEQSPWAPGFLQTQRKYALDGYYEAVRNHFYSSNQAIFVK